MVPGRLLFLATEKIHHGSRGDLRLMAGQGQCGRRAYRGYTTCQKGKEGVCGYFTRAAAEGEQSLLQNIRIFVMQQRHKEAGSGCARIADGPRCIPAGCFLWCGAGVDVDLCGSCWAGDDQGHCCRARNLIIGIV